MAGVSYHKQCLMNLANRGELVVKDKDGINQDLIPSIQEFRLIKAGVTVLEKCKETTKIFEQEKVPTMPLVVERMYNIDRELEEFKEDLDNSEMARDFASELQGQLLRRFPDYGTDRELSCFGNYLNPSIKGVHLKITDKFDSTKEKLEEKLNTWKQDKEVDNNDNPDDPEEVEPPTKKLSPTDQLKLALKAKELGPGSSRGRGRGRGRGQGRGWGQGRVTGSRVFEEPMSAFQRECRFTVLHCT